VVEVTQSAIVAVPGQPVDEELGLIGSVTEPGATTPVSVFDGKNGEDF
jgi:hypothetical protein